MSAATAEAVTANSKEDYKGDDDEPYYLILKELAEAVHINILSFIINGGWRFSLSNIMICERRKCVKGLCFLGKLPGQINGGRAVSHCRKQRTEHIRGSEPEA